MRGASIHVTLVFIGPTRPDTVPDLAAAARETAALHQPFQVQLGRAGSFGGGERPRVAWIGLSEGVEALRRLAAELHPRVFGRSAKPPRPLTPHLTVARRAEDDLVERIDATLASAPPVTWTADRLVLYRSHIGIGPPLHEELAVARLGGPATPAE